MAHNNRISPTAIIISLNILVIVHMMLLSLAEQLSRITNVRLREAGRWITRQPPMWGLYSSFCCCAVYCCNEAAVSGEIRSFLMNNAHLWKMATLEKSSGSEDWRQIFQTSEIVHAIKHYCGFKGSEKYTSKKQQQQHRARNVLYIADNCSVTVKFKGSL